MDLRELKRAAEPKVSVPRTLKRTISKCGLDMSSALGGLEPPTTSGAGVIAPKRLAPLHEPMGMATATATRRRQAHALVDQDEPVLLPLYTRIELSLDEQEAQDERMRMDFIDAVESEDEQGSYTTSFEEPEYSPELQFGWDDSPRAMKARYYESVLESSTAFVSPSPQHILYPYSPNTCGSSGGYSSSTCSSLFERRHTPPNAAAEGGMAMAMGLTEQLVSPPSSLRRMPPPPVAQDLEYLSAAHLHAIILEYFQEVFMYYQRARTFTFAQIGDMVQSVPFAFRYIQGLVKDRLGISWHLVGNFVEHVIEFICDEDIREATVSEFAGFLRSIQDKLYQTTPGGNIFANLVEFFHSVLARFKKYLITLWLECKRIAFPCEFGKKSSSLFLCMECHREHF